MTALEPLLEEIAGLSLYSLSLVVLAGLVVGVAPSSFPLLSVGAGLVAGHHTTKFGERQTNGLWLAAGFVLGIVTVDALLGALFGLAGFAFMRTLASILPLGFALIAVLLFVIGLALLRVIRIRIPVLNPSERLVNGFLGSYLLGLPFGLSSCPACVPLMLPVVLAAAMTADPLMGASLMAAFGIARGVPILLAGYVTGIVKNLRHSRSFILWIERAGGALMLAAAAYFSYQAALYAGWLTPL